jgi:hypothetical protein
LRPVYRVRQFVTALTARVSEADRAEADAHLPSEARALFRQMPRDGQAHALRVMRDLRCAGHSNAPLLAAALLHDAGKSAAHITPLTRSIFVVLKRLAPGRLARLSNTGWRQPLVALRDHAHIGAEWARRAGCDELTVSLIARHQGGIDNITSEEDRLLRILQTADDLN